MLIKTAKIQKQTQKEWEDENPILYNGTLVCESDTERFKIGDGKTPYRELNYIIDPTASLLFINLFISLIISFIITAVTWGLLSIITWVSELKFIWQFIGCGIIYFVSSIIINKISLNKK